MTGQVTQMNLDKKNDFKWTWTFKDEVNGNVALLMSEGSCKPPQVLIDIV